MFEIGCRDSDKYHFSEPAFDIADYNEENVMQVMTRKNVSSLRYLSHSTLQKTNKLEIIAWPAIDYKIVYYMCPRKSVCSILAMRRRS